MATSNQPAAFMSYARFNDQHDDGQLSEFRDRLAAEVRVQTGEEFSIFQDRTDIAWGQNWQQRIEQTLDVVTLLLVILTPGFFRSAACRGELELFLARERELGRQDLILPVYYVSSPELDDPQRRERDPLAAVLSARQFADWRELRFEPATSPVVRKTIAQLASRMRDTFWQQATHRPATSEGPGQASVSEAGSAEPATAVKAAAKTEPPTHVVDPYERGDFVSITAAIDAAHPGDRILVRPGLYREGLVIEKPLEIIGDGPLEDIEIQASDASALLFRANIARVTNLTLRQTGSRGEWYGLDITQGRLELEACNISSRSLTAVAIRNGADPRLRRNHIHDNQGSGVVIYEEGLGTLEDNDISSNTLNGVEIKSGANPTLRRNHIHDNSGSGLFVYENGLGTLEDNEISGNTLNGVEITTGANPRLRRNQVHNNKGSGVVVYDEGLGTLEDNNIAANTLNGVDIKSGASPTLNRNQIHDNAGSGLFVYENGLGTLEENTITANVLNGVGIKSGANPTLNRNQIHDNAGSGLFVYENGLGTFEENTITGNTLNGAEITENGDPVIRGNQINDNAGSGVVVYDNGLGTVEDNDITGNHINGVDIKTGGNPKIRGNRITNNTSVAVRIGEGGRGLVENNDLTGNAAGAWSIARKSEADVIRVGNTEQ